MHFNTKDQTDKKFGRLTVISYDGKSKWTCRCDCGNVAHVLTGNLTSGNSTSCGCYISEITSARNTTHGKTKHNLYGIWLRMRRRCNDPKHDKYPHYGGRGIYVSKEWNVSFQAFFDDMEPSWKRGLEIDRIDNNGPYSPDNCKWSTRLEQMQNTRSSRWLDTPNGRMTLSSAARYFGIPVDALSMRLLRGWSVDRAILTPVRKSRP